MLLKLTDITVTLGDKEVFAHADFFIKDKEKIALVGPNGSGKTTLINVILGNIIPDRDDKRKEDPVIASRKLYIESQSQASFDDLTKTFKDVTDKSFRNDEARDYYRLETEIDKLITGLGMDKLIKLRRLSELSGGQLKKLALIKAIVARPDILVLDEPTNHLDLEGVEWLENYLINYPGAVIIVSHDRFFLDRVCGVTVEIEDKRLIRYTGNYSEYKRQKDLLFEKQTKAYERYLEETKRLNQLYTRFKSKPTKASFARAKKKQMERIPEVKPPIAENRIDLNHLSQPEYLGPKWIYEADELEIGYINTVLKYSLRIKRGQKIALMGANGSGKSTMLKTIAKILQPLSGKQYIGEKVSLGYFDQTSGDISIDTTVREHFHEQYPDLTEGDLRKKLAMWMFFGSDVNKKISSLSGGEKTKLVLAEILQGCPNFLVLDEPTNHCDILAKEVLEKILGSYNGTELIVSHDRYFISRVADALLIIEDGELKYYPFGYEHYISRKSNLGADHRLAGELSAEDAALLNSVQNIPLRKKIQARELTTEEAHEDWVMGMADEILDQAYDKYEMKMLESTSIDEWNMAEDELTEAILAWYDEYMEFH